MRTEQLMRDHGIQRIVYLPADDLVPREQWHAWPFDSWLAEHCGRGPTIEAAIHDAVARKQERAA